MLGELSGVRCLQSLPLQVMDEGGHLICDSVAVDELWLV